MSDRLAAIEVPAEEDNMQVPMETADVDKKRKLSDSSRPSNIDLRSCQVNTPRIVTLGEVKGQSVEEIVGGPSASVSSVVSTHSRFLGFDIPVIRKRVQRTLEKETSSKTSYEAKIKISPVELKASKELNTVGSKGDLKYDQIFQLESKLYAYIKSCCDMHVKEHESEFEVPEIGTLMFNINSGKMFDGDYISRTKRDKYARLLDTDSSIFIFYFKYFDTLPTTTTKCPSGLEIKSCRMVGFDTDMTYVANAENSHKTIFLIDIEKKRINHVTCSSIVIKHSDNGAVPGLGGDVFTLPRINRPKVTDLGLKSPLHIVVLSNGSTFCCFSAKDWVDIMDANCAIDSNCKSIFQILKDITNFKELKLLSMVYKALNFNIIAFNAFLIEQCLTPEDLGNLILNLRHFNNIQIGLAILVKNKCVVDTVMPSYSDLICIRRNGTCERRQYKNEDFKENLMMELGTIDKIH